MRPTFSRYDSARSTASLCGTPFTWTGASMRLPRTLRWGNRLNSWNTIPALARSWRSRATSSRERFAIGAALTDIPAMSTAPALGSSRKLRQRRNVLLPLPERPRMVTASPGKTVIEQPRRTWCVPKNFSIAVALRIGSAPGLTRWPGTSAGWISCASRVGVGVAVTRSPPPDCAVAGGHPALEPALTEGEQDCHGPVDECRNQERLHRLERGAPGGLRPPQELLDGDRGDERRVLEHRHEVVADRRRHDPEGLGDDDPAERRAVAHPERLRGLGLAVRDGLDAGPEDLGHVRAVVQTQRDDARRQLRDDDAGLRQGQVDEQDLQEQRRPAEERDVEARDRVRDRIRGYPRERPECGEHDRERDRRARNEQCHRDARQDERNPLVDEDSVELDRREHERDEPGNDQHPRDQEADPPRAGPRLLGDEDLLGQQLVLRLVGGARDDRCAASRCHSSTPGSGAAIRPIGRSRSFGRQLPGFLVTSFSRYFIDSFDRVPSACMSATTLLSAAIIDLSSGPALSSAKATDTVKIGGPSRIRIGAVLAWSARPFALATMASYFRPAATACTQRLSVSRDTIFGSVGGGSLLGSTMSRLPCSHCSYVVAAPTQMLLPSLSSASAWTFE